MNAEPSKPTCPDFAQGIPLDDLEDGDMIGGHVGEEPVLLARRGDEFFAIESSCSHYGGPLADGLIVADTVRCPWHHARFSLRTGEAVGAPAFNPVPCWRVQKRDGKAWVREKVEPTEQRTALQDAASVASLLVTTEAMVAEAPKKQSAAPAMPGGGGMGGMDF